MLTAPKDMNKTSNYTQKNVILKSDLPSEMNGSSTKRADLELLKTLE